MDSLWVLNNFKSLPLLFQIGFRNGLKEGDRPTDKEFLEVYLRHPDWITYLGATELNRDELLKEYASHGKRVISIEEKDNKFILKTNTELDN